MTLRALVYLAVLSVATGGCLQDANAQQGVVQPAITPAAPPPPVATLPVPGSTPAAPAVSDKYVLGAEDVIALTVWKEPTLSSNLIVRPDGKISVGLIGEQEAAGKTPLELTAMITEKLKKFINDPVVTVTVTATNSQKIFFIGEVARPGPLMLTPDMTMLQAVSTAGGLTAYANSRKIYILRGAKGKQKKIPFDYKKAMKDGNQQGVELFAGDTIIVP